MFRRDRVLEGAAGGASYGGPYDFNFYRYEYTITQYRFYCTYMLYNIAPSPLLYFSFYIHIHNVLQLIKKLSVLNYIYLVSSNLISKHNF